MPRRFIAILLILSLSFQCFVKLGIVVWYEANKEYVAKTLCENRDKPQLNCCGKCYLRKQLKKADEGTPKGNNLPSKWNMGEIAVYVLPGTVSIPFVPTTSNESPAATNEQYRTYDPLNGVFRPPLYC